MFFQKLSALAENLDVQVRIFKKGDSLTVSIVPADATAIKPLSLTGTAAELDEGFLEAISAPLEAVSVKDQVAAYKKDLEQELAEKKKAVAAEVEKEAAAEDAKPAKPAPKKRRSKKDAAAEIEETPPAEVEEPAKSPAKKEAYAPVNPEATDDPNDLDLPAETETAEENLPVENTANTTVSEATGLIEETAPESSPAEIQTEEPVEDAPAVLAPVVETIAEDFTALAESALAEPVATPPVAPAEDEDDSFFAPPPMPIPLFD